MNLEPECPLCFERDLVALRLADLPEHYRAVIRGYSRIGRIGIMRSCSEEYVLVSALLELLKIDEFPYEGLLYDARAIDPDFTFLNEDDIRELEDRIAKDHADLAMPVRVRRVALSITADPATVQT